MNNDVPKFIDRIIASTKDARGSALIDAKKKFFDSMQDLGTIKAMIATDYISMDIPTGLGKRISRSVKYFIKEQG